MEIQDIRYYPIDYNLAPDNALTRWLNIVAVVASAICIVLCFAVSNDLYVVMGGGGCDYFVWTCKVVELWRFEFFAAGHNVETKRKAKHFVFRRFYPNRSDEDLQGKTYTALRLRLFC